MNINKSANFSNSTADPPLLNAGIYQEHSSMKWIFRFVFVIVFFVGIIGNSVVCWTVLRRKRMRSSNYIFTFNLAFSDLIFVVFYVPSQMAAYENNHNWALGAVMCPHDVRHTTHVFVGVRGNIAGNNRGSLSRSSSPNGAPYHSLHHALYYSANLVLFIHYCSAYHSAFNFKLRGGRHLLRRGLARTSIWGSLLDFDLCGAVFIAARHNLNTSNLDCLPC